MAPVTAHALSPAELSYLYTSLSQTPPIRPDGRTPTQFRPLVAETDILPSANGSGRICFADGTEAVVGIKAEVEKSTTRRIYLGEGNGFGTAGGNQEIEMGDAESGEGAEGKGEDSWLEIAIEIPSYRDDDALPVFLSAMLTEALLADGTLRDRLFINTRFHWRLYIDILLLSAPLSYPLPLLSLTTHLALLGTQLPRLISEKDEDPLFDDDWDAAVLLYPSTKSGVEVKPPVTLLVISVGDNIIFDPSKEELAVADSVLAVSVGQVAGSASTSSSSGLRVLAMRTIDPPSRLTTPGVPDSMNSATGGIAPASKEEALAMREGVDAGNVWRAPRGGMKRALVGRMIQAVVKKGGVAEEILEALAAVDT